MTKKRLSDLLKEEVQKPEGNEEGTKTPTPATPQEEPQASPEPAPKTAASARRTTGRRTRRTTGGQSSAKSGSADKGKTAVDATEAPTPMAKAQSAPSAEAAKGADAVAKSAATGGGRRTSAKVDLEARIQELEGALSQAKKSETALQKQVTGLQEDLDKQQSRLFELKDELSQAQADNQAKGSQLDKVTRDLEEAKATIRQLTDSKQTRSPIQRAPAHKYSAPDLATNRHTFSSPPPQSSAGGSKLPQGQTNGMLSDEDIGWVD